MVARKLGLAWLSGANGISIHRWIKPKKRFDLADALTAGMIQIECLQGGAADWA